MGGPHDPAVRSDRVHPVGARRAHRGDRRVPARAPAWWSGARPSPARSAPRTATRTTGAGRRRGSATPPPGCWWPGSRPAHGANRTGRVFTGDRSGDWLFAALHRAGFANQPTSTGIDDGLQLTDAYVVAAVRSAPPANRPTPAERDRCLPFLARELELLTAVSVIVVLGGFAWDTLARLLADTGSPLPSPRPRFGHGAEVPTATGHARRLLPPEPTEHLHRPTHRADARRRVSAGPRARPRTTLGPMSRLLEGVYVALVTPSRPMAASPSTRSNGCATNPSTRAWRASSRSAPPASRRR